MPCGIRSSPDFNSDTKQSTQESRMKQESHIARSWGPFGPLSMQQ
uniref:Uncharacterized protein n=1 Tax=Tetraselmis sp. GSL018 TaxID=582737 RepID=A0A061SPW4_9CHLO